MEKSHLLKYILLCLSDYYTKFSSNEIVWLLFISRVFGHLNGQLPCSQWLGISVQWLFEIFSFLGGGDRDESNNDSKQTPYIS